MEDWQRYKEEAHHFLVYDKEDRTVAIIELGWDKYADIIFNNLLKMARENGWKVVVRDMFRSVLCKFDYTDGTAGVDSSR